MSEDLPPQKSEIVKTTWLKPSLFGGRFTRKQYFCRILILGVVELIASTLITYYYFQTTIKTSSPYLADLHFIQYFVINGLHPGSLFITILANLLFGLPFAVKRAHDIGHSGTFVIALFIVNGIVQIIGALDNNDSWSALEYILFIPSFIYSLILLFARSEVGSNKYGASIKYPCKKVKF